MELPFFLSPFYVRGLRYRAGVNRMNTTSVLIPPPSPTSPSKLEASASAAEGRLVVVLQDLEDEALLAGRILSLAREWDRDVLLVGIGPRPGEEIELRRGLVTLAALIRAGGSRAEIRVEADRNWMQKLGLIVGPTDMLACCLERDCAAARPPLNVALSSQLNLPVYVFLGMEVSAENRGSISKPLAAWLGSLATILGFLWLQAHMVEALAGPAFTVLFILSVPCEIGLIWVWNSLLA
jgi:hypothetical protein